MSSPIAELAALNVVLYPHDRAGDRYVQLFQRAFELERPIRVHGHTYAMIGSLLEVTRGKPSDGLEGDIFRFTQIDMDSDWFDTRKKKPVSAGQARKEVVIPENLKPNLQRSRFVFFPKVHRLIFVSYFKQVSFSPNLALKLFERLLTDPRMANEFLSVEVTVEQSAEELEEILQRTRLEFLRIVIKRPNPDAPEDDDAKLEAVLEGQRAREQAIELKNAKGQFLKPNEENQQLARIATSNGHVEAIGLDQTGAKTARDTTKHPLTARFIFAEEAVFRPQFLDWARTVVQRIMSKFKK